MRTRFWKSGKSDQRRSTLSVEYLAGGQLRSCPILDQLQLSPLRLMVIGLNSASTRSHCARTLNFLMQVSMVKLCMLEHRNLLCRRVPTLISMSQSTTVLIPWFSLTQLYQVFYASGPKVFVTLSAKSPVQMLNPCRAPRYVRRLWCARTSYQARFGGSRHSLNDLPRECCGPLHRTRQSTASKLPPSRKSGGPRDERCARSVKTQAWNPLQVCAIPRGQQLGPTDPSHIRGAQAGNPVNPSPHVWR